jgi:hypothetical protein
VNEVDAKINYPRHRLTTEILNYGRRFQNRDLKAVRPAKEATVLFIRQRNVTINLNLQIYTY